MIEELERVVLLVGLPEQGLTVGDIGTVVKVHGDGEGYTVEFVTLTGRTVAVETLSAAQVRAINANEIAHARPLVAAS